MSSTDISAVLDEQIEQKEASQQIQFKPGQGLDIEVKLEAIVSISELMEKGIRSTSAIQQWLKDNNLPSSRDTTIKYRNLALKLIALESKPMNRENIRNLEIGRLTYWIENLHNRIEKFEEDYQGEHDEKYYSSLTKLIGKLNDFGARLHAITGLNEITINNEGSAKRIIFLRPGDEKPMSHNVEASEGEIIEAELTDQAISTSTMADTGTA